MYLLGTTLDWVEDTFKAEFVISNPNSKSSCGCGNRLASKNFSLSVIYTLMLTCVRICVFMLIKKHCPILLSMPRNVSTWVQSYIRASYKAEVMVMPNNWHKSLHNEFLVIKSIHN